MFTNQPTQTEDRQIRYQVISAATRKHRPLSTGYDSLDAARHQAEFLAEYGGVAKIVTTTGVIAKFSLSKGWH
jgi:hypothetical protein